MKFYIIATIITCVLLYLFPKTTIGIIILLIYIWNSGDNNTKNKKSIRKWINPYLRKDGTIVEGHYRR